MNKFTVLRTYRATDVCGNSATCTQLITVNDNTPPQITCPAPVTVQCAADVPQPNLALVTATDNCAGTVTKTFVSDVTTPGSCANKFTVLRTYRATDVCGNSATCTQLITVNDDTPPSITCPAPVTVQCAADVPIVNIGSVVATDNCAGTVTVTHVSDVTTPGSCVNKFTVLRTYRATDVCGNSATCTQLITVNDNTPPQITCPAPVTVQCAADVPQPNLALVTATDNCAGTVTKTFVSDVTTPGSCANKFTVLRTYRATDVCGNSATCTQLITVNDDTPPSITCPAPVTVQCAADVPIVNIGSVVATDNCAGTVTVTHVSDVTTPGSCVNKFTVLRTYRATDVCGNSATCTQLITVNDNTPPQITCPAPVTVQCAADVPQPNLALVTATDNCAGTVTKTFVSDVTTPGSCANKFTVLRTYRATDVCGNSATCTQLITVNDDTPPQITCPAPVTVQCAADVPTVNIGSVVATDNCAGTVTVTHVSDVTTPGCV